MPHIRTLKKTTPGQKGYSINQELREWIRLRKKISHMKNLRVLCCSKIYIDNEEIEKLNLSELIFNNVEEN